MSDKEILKEDDDIEVVEVDNLPVPGAEPEVKAKPDKVDDPDEDADDPEDDADDAEDSRMSADHADDEDDTPQRRKRLRRKQLQKEAKDRTLAEVQALRHTNAEMARRLEALEGRSLNTDEAQLNSRLEKVREDVAMADRILAKAIEAGNGEDYASAMRMRDEAKTQESELTRIKGTFAEARKVKPVDPRHDPATVANSVAWKSANPWYGQDARATSTVNAIDNQLMTEGYDPRTPIYWETLTERAKGQLETAAPRPKGDETPRRKAPPQGGRSDAGGGTGGATKVFVTPDRKQAMVEAGIWDDPERRTRMLKAYAKYDREQSANR